MPNPPPTLSPTTFYRPQQATSSTSPPPAKPPSLQTIESSVDPESHDRSSSSVTSFRASSPLVSRRAGFSSITTSPSAAAPAGSASEPPWLPPAPTSTGVATATATTGVAVAAGRWRPEARRPCRACRLAAATRERSAAARPYSCDGGGRVKWVVKTGGGGGGEPRSQVSHTHTHPDTRTRMAHLVHDRVTEAGLCVHASVAGNARPNCHQNEDHRLDVAPRDLLVGQGQVGAGTLAGGDGSGFGAMSTCVCVCVCVCARARACVCVCVCVRARAVLVGSECQARAPVRRKQQHTANLATRQTEHSRTDIT